nr:hypothetical protein [uncultured bacterium]
MTCSNPNPLLVSHISILKSEPTARFSHLNSQIQTHCSFPTSQFSNPNPLLISHISILKSELFSFL